VPAARGSHGPGGPGGLGGVVRASVRHGVVGLGVLTLLLPAELLVRTVRTTREAQAAREARASRAVHVLPVTGPTADRTQEDARHTKGEAARAGEEKARGSRHRRSRRVTGRRPPSEMVIPMCTHRPACPPAHAPDRDAARVVRTHPDQGWSLLCNGVVLFDDLGQLLPDGGITGTGAQQVALLRRYGSRRRRTAPPQAA
jgi:hypothetical protein